MTTNNHLIPRLISAATPDTGVRFLGSTASGGQERITWEQLHFEARVVAHRLQAHGIGRGTHVAILGPSTRALVTAVQGLWLSGATVVLLPLPMRLASIEAFVEQTRSRIANADAHYLLVDADLAPFAPVVDGVTQFVLTDLTSNPTTAEAERWVEPELDAEDMAVLQFTSGSTSAPKGVMVLHRTLLANLDGVMAAANVQETDSVCHWLPLYHDMGFIGLTTIPMISGLELALAAPQDFLAAPARWMEWMSETRATITAGPNCVVAWSTSACTLRESRSLPHSHRPLRSRARRPGDD